MSKHSKHHKGKFKRMQKMRQMQQSSSMMQQPTASVMQPVAGDISRVTAPVNAAPAPQASQVPIQKKPMTAAALPLHYEFIGSDLRRIGILTAIIIAILVVLFLFLK